MKVLQIGWSDKNGNRFNGSDLMRQLNSRGIETRHCVYLKKSDDPNTWQLKNLLLKLLNYFPIRLEKKLSLQSLFTFSPFVLPFYKFFRNANIIHLQNMHVGNGLFSIASLPYLSKMKPIIWTLHDFWGMTGHCSYPYDCTKWKNGCNYCSNLEIDIPLTKDHASFLWKLKQYSYSLSKIDIILASKFMYDAAKSSPLLSKFRLHHIPFGLDLNIFKPMDKIKSRKEFNIKPNNIVIAFRSTMNKSKGLVYIIESLQHLKSTVPITLLTFSSKGLINELKNKFDIVELGWVQDEDKLVKAYNAVDFFLMPSTQEAFGMMAIEAMACGKPIIVFNGTSLPEIIKDGGLVVKQKDVKGLSLAIDKLIIRKKERELLAKNALSVVEANYDIKNHIDKIIELYKNVISSREKS